MRKNKKTRKKCKRILRRCTLKTLKLRHFLSNPWTLPDSILVRHSRHCPTWTNKTGLQPRKLGEELKGTASCVPLIGGLGLYSIVEASHLSKWATAKNRAKHIWYSHQAYIYCTYSDIQTQNYRWQNGKVRFLIRLHLKVALPHRIEDGRGGWVAISGRFDPPVTVIMLSPGVTGALRFLPFASKSSLCSSRFLLDPNILTG